MLSRDLAQFVEQPESVLDKTDVALRNLLCAVDLPGAEDLDVPGLLETLDEWAELIRLETDRNYYKFIDAPGMFNNSQAYFCVLYMITVLQRKCGVRYNPKWTSITPDKPVPRDFGRDASDLFIHAIIDGPGGTCGSLPVLYAAVGRRLGYPLKIVKAHQHLFSVGTIPRPSSGSIPTDSTSRQPGRGFTASRTTIIERGRTTSQTKTSKPGYSSSPSPPAKSSPSSSRLAATAY